MGWYRAQNLFECRNLRLLDLFDSHGLSTNVLQKARLGAREGCAESIGPWFRNLTTCTVSKDGGHRFVNLDEARIYCILMISSGIKDEKERNEHVSFSCQ